MYPFHSHREQDRSVTSGECGIARVTNGAASHSPVMARHSGHQGADGSLATPT